jgi:hypothetical protein
MGKNNLQKHISLAILCSLLVCSAFAVQRQVDLHYYDDLELFNLTSATNVTVEIKSLPGNDATIPITV